MKFRIHSPLTKGKKGVVIPEVPKSSIHRPIDRSCIEAELDQAAAILATDFPQIWFEAWKIILKNNMGYRIAPILACAYGEDIDPVTRRCVVVGPPEELPEGEPARILPIVPGEPKTWAIVAGAYLLARRLL